MKIKKMIYFPSSYEGAKEPTLIYVNKKVLEEYRGAADKQQLESGRFTWYQASRVTPYTEQLWRFCLRHIERRRQLEEEYKQLIKQLSRIHNK